MIFEGGPYFYNSAGLYLHFWTDCFCPEKENFTHICTGMDSPLFPTSRVLVRRNFRPKPRSKKTSKRKQATRQKIGSSANKGTRKLYDQLGTDSQVLREIHFPLT
jgi:hypothetical protein